HVGDDGLDASYDHDREPAARRRSPRRDGFVLPDRATGACEDGLARNLADRRQLLLPGTTGRSNCRGSLAAGKDPERCEAPSSSAQNSSPSTRPGAATSSFSSTSSASARSGSKSTGSGGSRRPRGARRRPDAPLGEDESRLTAISPAPARRAAAAVARATPAP